VDALGDFRQHLLHADCASGTAGVEHADGSLLGYADSPFGQITGIDELHRVAPVARR
jgi:hypothetical protein